MPTTTTLLTMPQMPDPSTMNMLYKIAAGGVQEEHYGLTLARIVQLPPQVYEHATVVAQKLNRLVAKRRRTSAAVILQRRRRLILNLKEHLVQTKDGNMEDGTLTAWLKQLQREFVVRMSALDAEAESAEVESETDIDDGNDAQESQHEAVGEDADEL